MKQQFSSYYRKSDAETQLIWNNCLFIFDANVLLGLYRYPKKISEEIFKVLKLINSRIWIPHQVALEFYRNRMGEIWNQLTKYDEVANKIKQLGDGLINDISDVKFLDRHSVINIQDFNRSIDKCITDYIRKIRSQKKNHKPTSESDDILNKLEILFTSKTGLPFSQSDLDSIYIEGDDRYKKSIPPGYKDRTDKKNKVFYSAGITILREYGDLIIWKQIIQKANQDGIKQIVYVTDDAKEDWWWIVNGKKSGPRIELIEEIKLKSPVEDFLMYDSDSFLHNANRFLTASIDNETMHYIKDILNSYQSEQPSYKYKYYSINSGVLSHFSKLFPGAVFIPDHNFDFMFSYSGRTCYVDIKLIEGDTYSVMSIIERYSIYSVIPNCDTVYIVLVINRASHSLMLIKSHLETSRHLMPSNLVFKLFDFQIIERGEYSDLHHLFDFTS